MHRLDQGGGYLNNMLSHDIDFVCHLFGEPRSVCADVTRAVSTSTPRDGTTIDADADDNAVLIVRLVGGATAVLSMSTVSRGCTRGLRASARSAPSRVHASCT